MPSATPRPEEHQDGRVARGERTRQRLLDAHADLLREGVLRPTAVAVAARAGVSIRALWGTFKDLEELAEAAGVEWGRAYIELEEDIDPDLPLAERVVQFSAQRARRMEMVAPAMRSHAFEPTSPTLRHQRRGLLARLQDVITTVFATELERAGEAAPEVLVALVTLCSSRSWLVMRDDFGLTPDAAEAVMRRAVLAALGGFSDPPNR